MSPARWLMALGIVVSSPSGAQVQGSGPRAELRAELTSAEVPSAQIAIGAHVVAGTYLRVAVIGGAGIARHGDEWGRIVRAEVQGRFHLDPYRLAPLGLYGIGGVLATHDRFASGQARLVIGGGLEFARRGNTSLAVEAALVGGYRLALIARRVRRDRR